MEKDTNSLWAYVQDSKENLLIAVRKQEMLIEGSKTETVHCEDRRNIKVRTYKGRDMITWDWLSSIQKQIEGMIMAAANFTDL